MGSFFCSEEADVCRGSVLDEPDAVAAASMALIVAEFLMALLRVLLLVS